MTTYYDYYYHHCCKCVGLFQPCGVDYELKTFVADSMDEKPHKRYTPAILTAMKSLCDRVALALPNRKLLPLRLSPSREVSWA
jgi:hypothetical protein